MEPTVYKYHPYINVTFTLPLPGPQNGGCSHSATPYYQVLVSVVSIECKAVNVPGGVDLVWSYVLHQAPSDSIRLLADLSPNRVF